MSIFFSDVTKIDQMSGLVKMALSEILLVYTGKTLTPEISNLSTQSGLSAQVICEIQTDLNLRIILLKMMLRSLFTPDQAETLNHGVAADIWYDARQFEDEDSVLLETQTNTMNTMEELAKVINEINGIEG